ncbi:MAG: UDP-N-acetylmuramoyl-L-alanine--D-glutamate ligase [Clostridia bacterium]|nr:UDP-N-acetylmuramoyl-L-alanine--D-glutamate ligase [Clostridia bacterium]
MTDDRRWSRDWTKSRVLICGMARSGVAAAQTLSRLGAELLLHDRRTPAELPQSTQEALHALRYADYLGRSPEEALDGADVLVVSPGLPLSLPYLEQARRRRLPIVGEIELGYQLSAADFIAITGTNGKTTTTALTGEIFKAGGENTYVLGNIGDPLSAHALETEIGDVVVLETAALQLDTIDRFHPFGSAVLNVTPDHLDRYGTMENYTAAKRRILENQGGLDYTLINGEDPVSRQLADYARMRIGLHTGLVTLGPGERDGMSIADGWIVWRRGGDAQRVMRAADVCLPGRHNLQNALFAAGLALEYGIPASRVAEVLATFAGVEHRLETVATRNGVIYINDSKGTNPDATIKAVEAVTQPTVLILGGFDKHADFAELFASFRTVRQILVLGETKEKILEAAAAAGFSAVQPVADLEEAVREAARIAEPGDAVLLSPACASWDMYASFEERGRHFKSLVMAL